MEGEHITISSERHRRLPDGICETLIKVFFFVSQELTGGKRILEKTPNHHMFLDIIFRIFPKAKVIHCHRDPVYVISSIRKRLKKEKEAGRPEESYRWLARDIAFYVDKYKSAQRNFTSASEKYPERVALAVYERITSNPEAEIKKLCLFAGVRFEEGMVTGKGKAVTSSEFHYRDGIQGNSYAADEFLSSEEIMYIQDNTKEFQHLTEVLL
jgi:hypothetical protein